VMTNASSSSSDWASCLSSGPEDVFDHPRHAMVVSRVLGQLFSNKRSRSGSAMRSRIRAMVSSTS
jgi:hypothetical protein